MGSSGHVGVFWAWVEGATDNMAFALDGLVEQVRSWVAVGGLSGLGLASIMDTLNTLLVGWMIFVALILIIGTFFYFKFIYQYESGDLGRPHDTQPRGEPKDEKNKTAVKKSAPGRSGPEVKPAEPARKPTIVPDRSGEPVTAPVATGADPDAVKWTNNVFTWLYNSVDGGPAIRKTWLDTVNENTVKTALETGILVEVVEVYKVTAAPTLSNMVVDCSPTDNVTITCDCDATIYLRIMTTRTQGETTTESEYACAVSTLRGRLNIASITSELMAVVKFDGWPEVALELEGIRNNSTGLNEQQMLDVVDEVLTSALRNSVLDVNFQSSKTFPKFRRARQVPDPIIPVGYDSMVRESQTHPPSAPRKPKKSLFASIHDEEIEEAGESFTALTFSSNLSKQINLTTSEEQLIARNLHKYPSLENTEIGGDDISEICKSWEENYVPAAEVPSEDHETVVVPVTVPRADQKEKSQTQNFVLVASNRSKLIDEPRTVVSIEEIEEEEPELELHPVRKPHVEDEPCIRRGSRSPLLLGHPKIEEPQESVELKELEELLQLDKIDISDKSLTSTSGFGPLPSLPGLQKGPFVSEACCVGVKVGVAAENPELDLRVETAPVDDSVACDLSECDQEVVIPVEPLLQTQVHNHSAIDDLSLYSVTDTANISIGSQREPIPLPNAVPSLEPETSSASALSAVVGNRSEDCNLDSSFLSISDEKLSLDSGYFQDTSFCKDSPVTHVCAAVTHEGTNDADTDTGNEACDRESFDRYPVNQVQLYQDKDLKLSEQPLICHLDKFLENEVEIIDECRNESADKNEVCKAVNTDTFKDELGYKKMCFNEFTESLFRHIELEELEISIPEEVTEDPALEMAEIYETNDKSLIVSETSDWESGEIEEETDNETENLETTLDSHEDTADDVESDDSLSTDVSQHQNFEPKKLYLETDFGVFNADTNTRILSTNCGVDEIIASRHHNELYKDSDTPSEEEVARQYGYTELKESSFEESNGSFTDNCDDSLQEKDDLSRVTDNRTPESPFIMEETTNTSNVDKRLDEKNVTDEIYIMKIEDNAVVKETNDLEFHEQLTQEQGVNSNTVAEVAPYMKLQEDLHSIVSFCQTPSSSLQTIDSNLTANDSQKIMDNKLNLTDKKLEEGEYDKNLDIKINPTTEVNAQDPFSPAEDDFIFHNDEDITNGTQDESRCDYDYALLESSSSDSEVEGITGKYSGKELNDSLQGRSLSGKNWRNSDIELIMEAESFVIPNDHVSTTLGCEVKDVQELPEDDSLGKNLKDAHGLSQDNVLNTSQKDAQIVPQISLLNHNLKDTQDSLQEAPGIEVQSNILTFSEGSMLTTKTGSVAPLTQPDTTCALTLQQGTSHTRKEYTTGDDFMKDASFTSGQHHWTRPLPTHPVYGTSYVVSALPSTTTGQSMGIPGLNGKRLLVKIVKATSVGCDKSVCEAYAVVEMDEPPQKFTTSVVKDTSSPFWDEQFLFDLSGGTLELLFEVYDKKDGNFLGLGIVGIEELVATPSQRQIIPLQSRPYENDEVSGSLTVEFLFLDRADLPEHTLRSSATSQSLTSKGDLITTTTTTYVKAPELQDVIVNGGDGVAAVALRDIEEKKTVVANNASKSTMIIHASRKPDEEGEYPEFPTEDLTALTTTATTTTPIITTTSTHSTAPSTSLSPTTTTTSTTNATTNADAADPLDTDERGRSRGSRRKRDSFFGTLKKRFSRSKVRSKSMDPSARDTSMDRDASVGRSISAERSANLNRASEQQQVNPPSLRDTIAPRLLSVPANVGGDGGSTRSSLSDASAISSSSTRTYVNEASTLIIETSENGVFKHYLIPLALQQKSKWRKKGLKLHIFGEHTFLAKHMSSTTPCEVCHKTLGRRFGKQGYVCRDCGFKCHKPCHVKTEIICPNSTVNSMDLLDDLVCGEEGVTTKKFSKSYQKLSSSFSSSVPLPTIQEKLPVDETCNVLSESSDSNHNSHISVEKGKHCQGPGSVEDLQEARCIPMVQRSVSLGLSKVCPKINSYGAKLGLSSSLPEAPVTPDMMELLLPAINVEQFNDNVHHR